MNEKYTPISCSMHDQLLALATRRQPCELIVESDEAPERQHQITGLIVDVYSRNGAEYLRLADGMIIRLDRIITVDGERVTPA